MRLVPLSDRVIIRPLPVEEQSKGGILIPENAKDKPVKGEVIAVGPGKWADFATSDKRIPMDLVIGDIVLYGKYVGTEVALDETLLVVKESDILAKVEE